MRILFIGDIAARSGRRALQDLLANILERHHVDFCVANCENAASGFGITPQLVDDLFELKIDLLTSGNHIWDRKEIFDLLPYEKRLLRPANYPRDVPGSGSSVVESRTGAPVGVVNVSGLVFMESLACPFRTVEQELARMEGVKLILVDFHAEATSEKICMGYFLDGRVTAVLGTHTHVQTADERVLPGGTAYISDVGMTGPAESVIGIKKELVLRRFLSRLPVRFESADGPGQINAVLIDADEATGRAHRITRLQAVNDKS